MTTSTPLANAAASWHLLAKDGVFPVGQVAQTSFNASNDRNRFPMSMLAPADLESTIRNSGQAAVTANSGNPPLIINSNFPKASMT